MRVNYKKFYKHIMLGSRIRLHALLPSLPTYAIL